MQGGTNRPKSMIITVDDWTIELDILPISSTNVDPVTHGNNGMEFTQTRVDSPRSNGVLLTSGRRNDSEGDEGHVTLPHTQEAPLAE